MDWKDRDPGTHHCTGAAEHFTTGPFYTTGEDMRREGRKLLRAIRDIIQISLGPDETYQPLQPACGLTVFVSNGFAVLLVLLMMFLVIWSALFTGVRP